MLRFTIRLILATAALASLGFAHAQSIDDSLRIYANVHPNQITSWKAQLEEGAADVFGSGGGNGGVQPAVDVKSLHAKTGELTPTEYRF